MYATHEELYDLTMISRLVEDLIFQLILFERLLNSNLNFTLGEANNWNFKLSGFFFFSKQNRMFFKINSYSLPVLL